ncbi:MAG: palindromic element RPE4 domain-containing protein [Alphaproteobacteria bacterium]|nr:MAG: palindromic element RPE4 domain-containing protein [Alphaproteobacteria bacterium]
MLLSFRDLIAESRDHFHSPARIHLDPVVKPRDDNPSKVHAPDQTWRIQHC